MLFFVVFFSFVEVVFLYSGFFSSAVLSYFPTIMPFLMPCQSSLPGINPIKTFLSKFNDSYLKATPFLEQRKNIYSYKMVWFTKKNE